MAYWAPSGRNDNPFDGYEALFRQPRGGRYGGPRPGAMLRPGDREGPRRVARNREAVMAKRRAQKELGSAREALARALDVGDAEAAGRAAEAVAQRRAGLLEISRSASTLETVAQTDEELAGVPDPEELPGCARVRQILEATQPLTESVDPFIERASRLRAELEALQKEYLRLDSHISKAQIALDSVETVGEGPSTARAMRRKANDHLAGCLEAIDEAANPLRDMFQQELFKSSQYF